jgi:hypothetical protein
MDSLLLLEFGKYGVYPLLDRLPVGVTLVLGRLANRCGSVPSVVQVGELAIGHAFVAVSAVPVKHRFSESRRRAQLAVQLADADEVQVLFLNGR